ncbi:3beta-hydroxysteroid-dehydrogenase/decarboxylase isoform 2 [Capsicum baccatum]|uniref:3beta-hydroxysteroid-dehydrogenase/decarboxylase isoform 2 n=1 Tax=Capsicum baccatum TaxID=33114 RepID=A0A2G2V4T4_CAPBA|nr:3beta-hydroxysteroid-dehydrogenase/decarboxylase isoform 2 [Capsicum baccatum]
MDEEKWCVVTGGRGFAARHLVLMLIRYEICHVRIADLGPTIKLEPHEEEGTLGQALKSGRAAYVSMDLTNKSQVLEGLLLNLYLFLTPKNQNFMILEYGCFGFISKVPTVFSECRIIFFASGVRVSF